MSTVTDERKAQLIAAAQDLHNEIGNLTEGCEKEESEIMNKYLEGVDANYIVKPSRNPDED